MSLFDRTVHGGAWQVIAVATQALLQAIVIATLSRHIAPEDFGLIAIVVIITSFVTAVSQAGFGSALIHRRELTSGHVNVAFITTVILSFAITALLHVLAPTLAVYFDNGRIETVVRWVSLSIPFSIFGIVSRSLLERKLKFKQVMWANTASYVFGYALVSVSLALLGFGVWALVSGILAQYLLLSITMFLLSPYGLSWRFTKQEFIDLFHFSSGQSLAQLFHFVLTNCDLFIIGKLLGAGELGIYERLRRVADLPGRYLDQVLSRVLFPAMAEIQDDTQRLKRAYLSSVALTNAILMPLSASLVVSSQEIVAVLLGPTWQVGILAFQILMAALFLKSAVGLSDALLRAVGAVYPLAWRKATVAALAIVGCLFAAKWGLVGVAAAMTAAGFLRYALTASLAARLTGASIGELIGAHRAGVVLTPIAIAVTLLTIVSSRQLEFPALLALAITFLCAPLACIATLLAFPAVLGNNGRWMLLKLLNRLPGDTRVVRFLDLRFQF